MPTVIKHCAAALLLTASSYALCSCTTKGEQVAAEETAEQIEDARIAGREAARVFVNTPWKDSIQLQGQLLESNVKRSERTSGPKSREAFDSAFISTVRTVRPEVAATLQRYKDAHPE